MSKRVQYNTYSAFTIIGRHYDGDFINEGEKEMEKKNFLPKVQGGAR